jgi:hypothetical protein
MVFVAGAVVQKHRASVAKYPNIETGEDFEGY